MTRSGKLPAVWASRGADMNSPMAKVSNSSGFREFALMSGAPPAIFFA
jgi:hypothetical protein